MLLYKPWGAYIGSIVGKYEAKKGPCEIENILNMASVSFIGA